MEHWRSCAKMGGYFWQIRNEWLKCKHDVAFYKVIYSCNLKELFIPIVRAPADLDLLLSDPDGEGWKEKELQNKLVERLQESYEVYMEIIKDMNETADELRTELCFDNAGVQEKRAPPSTKKECNERLGKLLRMSDEISGLRNAPRSSIKQISKLENAFKSVYRKSDRLFKALEKAWNCLCRQYHFANLRLEHRSSTEACFEIILMSLGPPGYWSPPWTWVEIHARGAQAITGHHS
ncbi:hypothetical protein K458DRAFT_384553 [Lentithecium fluviatile CBS 122367]|uniref:Uncharacterized protein n=1 Tax=Lentithecium fluviatile CBS 122367 TaxID=1168545 RepID=A0A6G1JE12_9PLEO|nr:hypothetical protein K458DRAFT_384553 [Lentithecium fluviatile CBS 122367]